MFLRKPEYYLTRFHDKQEEAWLNYKAGKNLVLDWGRRSGKSELVAEILLEDIEDNGKDCLYCALSAIQAREILWPKLQQKKTSWWRTNETRLQMVFSGNWGNLFLKGLDLGKDRLRGGAKRVIVLDEYAFAKDPSVVKEVLIPQLADFNGQIIYLSTPKGKNHFWKLKQLALKNPDKYFTSKATIFDNPFISEEGRSMLLSEYSGVDDPLYRQEVLAEYIDYEGLVFALPQDSLIEDRWQEGDMEHSFHWRCVDHGFSPDPTACLWMCYNHKLGHFQIYNEYKKEALLIHKHAEVINKMEQYRFQGSYCDVDPQVKAEYIDVGLHLDNATKGDKEARLLRVVNALKMGKLKINRNCTKLLDEMLTYTWGQDHNDDLIDSLSMLWASASVPEEQPEEEFEPKKRFDPTGQDFGD
jgi:hypothetical protein